MPRDLLALSEGSANAGILPLVVLLCGDDSSRRSLYCYTAGTLTLILTIIGEDGWQRKWTVEGWQRTQELAHMCVGKYGINRSAEPSVAGIDVLAIMHYNLALQRYDAHVQRNTYRYLWYTASVVSSYIEKVRRTDDRLQGPPTTW